MKSAICPPLHFGRGSNYLFGREAARATAERAVLCAGRVMAPRASRGDLHCDLAVRGRGQFRPHLARALGRRAFSSAEISPPVIEGGSIWGWKIGTFLVATTCAARSAARWASF